MTEMLKNNVSKIRIFMILILLLLMLPLSTKVYGAVIDSGSCGENSTYEFDDETGTLTIRGIGAMDNYGYQNRTPWHLNGDEVRIINVSEGITSIGDYAFSVFYSKSYLTTVNLPDSLISIGNGAFNECDTLTEITIPEGVETIGGCAFKGCFNLVNVSLPSTVTNIGGSAFAHCGRLKSITIPSGVTTIEGCTFYYCTSLTDVNLPDNITGIGERAFSVCTSLQAIELPSKLKSIGPSAFDTCIALTEVIIPEGVTKIEKQVFNQCPELTRVVIPNSVTAIENNAFKLSTNLVDVGLSQYVLDIKSDAFSGCNAITLKVENDTYAHNFAVMSKIPYTVVDDPNPLTAIELDYNSLYLEGKDSSQLKVSYNPENTLSKLTVWNSSNRYIADVDDNGLVTAVSSGTVTITARNGNCIDTCEVEVFVAPLQSISFEESEIDIKNNDPEKSTKKLNVIFNPTNTTDDKTVTWSSINNNIASVENGVVTAVSFGTTIIEARVGDEMARCYVNVTGDFSDNVTSDYYDGTYDGKPHGIKVYAPEGAEVTYSLTGETGTYKIEDNAISEVGLVEVFYKVSLADCDDVYGSNFVLIRPSYPESMELSLTGYDDVRAVWSDVYGAAGYDLYYGKEDNKELIYYISTTNTTATFNNLYDGKEYEIAVVPYILVDDIKIQSSYYSYDFITTLKKVNTPYISKSSDNYVKVKWTNIVGEDGYQISRSTSPTGTWIVSTYSTTSGNYKTLKTTRYKDYYYKVRAFKVVDGERIYGPWSNVRYYKLGPAIVRPGAPSYINARLNGGHDDVKITWGKADNADGYYIYYRTSSSSEYKYLARTTNRYYYKKDLYDGKKYYFKIVPYTVVGGYRYKSRSYKTDSVYTLKKISTPYISESSKYYTKVKWTNISGETGYQISRSTSPTGTYIVSTYSTTSGNYKTLKTTRYKDYYYKVRAYKYVDGKRIYGPWSNVRYFKLGPAIPRPEVIKLKADLYGYDDVKVSWDENEIADGYYVYYRRSTSSSYTYMGRTTNNYIKKANLYDGRKYYFKVVPYVYVGGYKYKSTNYSVDSIYTLKKIDLEIIREDVGKIKLTWNNIYGETGYQFARTLGSEIRTPFDTYKTTRGTHRIFEGAEGWAADDYAYSIRSYRIVDGKYVYGPWSDWAYFK